MESDLANIWQAVKFRMAANPELKDEVVEVQYGMLFPEKALVVAALVVGGVFLLTSL